MKVLSKNVGTFNVIKTGLPTFFTVGNEAFEVIPAEKLLASGLATYFQSINDGDLFKAHDAFLEIALTNDSYKRFNSRLYSKNNPITLSTLAEVTSWLVGDVFLGGKTYGRARTLIHFALDDWESFDSWCLIHGIKDIWSLPSYRFGALAIAYLKFDKVPESVTVIDESLFEADKISHPFVDHSFRNTLITMGSLLSIRPSTSIVKKAFDIPIEERKRQEAIRMGKAFRVPEWWQGERANYKIASSMMKVLPRKIGPVKD